eukprot:TRINITY_DN65257_c0_g2_i1.p2 TRINITY_DN65257_c0_g2~~TRINITY_DN65257_c0_g2_i1.p2  ORF type:complete len:443 (-),score=20.25 TRINITY_DN65257_c0_g2_i1:2018-3346(-)
MARAFSLVLFAVALLQGWCAYPPLYYTQPKDHTDTNSTTFSQLYYEVKDHYIPNNHCPIFIYLGGPEPLQHISGVTDLVADLARQNGAIVYSLEHRYFGQSQPTADLSVANLHFLTVDQVIEDIASFARTHMSPDPGFHNVTLFGEGYAGGLAVWTKHKYPELISVVYSSGAPVVASLLFPQYDLHTTTAMGPACAQSLRVAFDGVYTELKTNPTFIKNLFGASVLTDTEFLWMLSEAVTIPVMNGDTMHSPCGTMATAVLHRYELMEALKYYVVKVFYPTYLSDVGPVVYSSKMVARVQKSLDTAPMRSWLWLKCSELGYAQVNPGPTGLRSSMIDEQFFAEQCETVFQKGIWPPNVKAFNTKYGDPDVDHTFYMYGAADPWQWLGHTMTTGPTALAHVAIGNATLPAGHGFDMKPFPHDAPVDWQNALWFASQEIFTWLH